MDLLKKIVSLGYEVNIGLSSHKDGYVISISGLFGFKTKCENKEFPECKDLESGLKIVYDFVK